jgi:hypothetical protein
MTGARRGPAIRGDLLRETAVFAHVVAVPASRSTRVLSKKPARLKDSSGCNQARRWLIATFPQLVSWSMTGHDVRMSDVAPLRGAAGGTPPWLTARDRSSNMVWLAARSRRATTHRPTCGSGPTWDSWLMPTVLVPSGVGRAA